MAFRVIEETDECIVQNQGVNNIGEDVDEVQIEINEILPSDTTQSNSAVMAKPNHRIFDEGEMEEGELSGEDLYDANRRRVLEDGSSDRMSHNRRQPIQITIQNKEAAKLPVCSVQN